MLDTVLILEYWDPRKGARLAMHRSSGAGAVQLSLSPRLLPSGALFVILVRDASCLGGPCCSSWCSAGACVAIIYALFFYILARGLANGSGPRSGLVNFGGSSHCAACYFWDLVWARSILGSSSGGSPSRHLAGVPASCRWGSKWSPVPLACFPSPHFFILPSKHVPSSLFHP